VVGSWTIYVVGDRVVVPTLHRAATGLLVEREPVEVAPAGDVAAVAAAIWRVVERGNPRVELPPHGASWSKPVVLRPARVRSWAALERVAFPWTLEGGPTGFRLIPQVPSPPRGFVEVPTRAISSPPCSTPEAAARWAAVAILEASGRART